MVDFAENTRNCRFHALETYGYLTGHAGPLRALFFSEVESETA